ncbi:MAG TPA: nucleotidyltransferase domain-containing protein [Gammaproteobacteria bacterium]|nr:nucleotidyltransferase domain-containing protein [Gammaproteobacteria bacterium]
MSTANPARALVLTPEQQAEIHRLLQQYLPGIEVRAYGSRVKGTAKPWSDLDLAVLDEAGSKTAIADLKYAFEESDLPFRVDLFLWSELPDSFRENIEKEHLVLQKKGHAET